MQEHRPGIVVASLSLGAFSGAGQPLWAHAMVGADNGDLLVAGRVQCTAENAEIVDRGFVARLRPP